MGQDPDIAPWDAPDPSTLKASATPTPARRDEPATPIGPRRRRSLLGQTTAVEGIPEREFDPDLQEAAPIDAPVPVAAHLARAGIDADVRVNTHTPPPVRRADEPAEPLETVEPVEPVEASTVPLASDTLVPEAALGPDTATDGLDPALDDWTVDEQDDAAEPIGVVVPSRSWGPVAVGVGALGTVALLAALALGVGWRIEAGEAEAPVAAAEVPQPAPVAIPEPTDEDVAPGEDDDEAIVASAPAPAPASAPATPAPTTPAPTTSAPTRATAPPPAPTPTEVTESEARSEGPPPPPAAQVRPRTGDAPPQATVRPVREEDGRKVWAPWGEDAEAPPEAEEPEPPAEEEEEGDIWGTTE